MRTLGNLGQLKNLQVSLTNRMLARLPRGEFERLIPDLRYVPLPKGEVLYEAGDRIRHAYFLNENALASVIFTMQDGAGMEVCVVGSEGLVSIQAYLGPLVYPARIVVQSTGSALRIDAEILRAAFHRGGVLQSVLLRYTQAVVTQIAQAAACNHLHTVEQRLARWLLTIHDRVPDDISLTQEVISRRLGIHRSSISEAIVILQQRGVIRHTRGHIAILEPASLRAVACECYEIIKKQYDFLPLR